MADKKPKFARKDFLPMALLLLISAGIFWVDLLIPLGVAAGVPYFALVFAAAWVSWRHGILLFALLGTALTILGYLYSAPGGIVWMVAMNRGLAFFAIWVTAILLMQRRSAEEALKTARDDLEGRVRERTEELNKANALLTEQIAEINDAQTALRESEVRLHGVMDNVVDGIITIDEQGIIDTFNPGVERMFGYPAGEVQGKNVKILMPEPDRSQHDGYLADYKRTGHGKIIGIGAREVMGMRKDGSTFPIELLVSVMETGGKRYFIGVARDISLRKDTEAQLQQAQKMEAVGQLTGGVAHDFNNLLAVILGNTELLQDELGDNALLASIDRAATRGAELTQRLLAFARQQSLEPQPVDLAKLIPGLDNLFRRTLGEPVTISIDVPDVTWPVSTDPGQLENALLNLAINARDAMPEGGILEIRCENVQVRDSDKVAAGDYVQIAVRDSGSGMPEGVREHAFEPFFTTKEVGEGSGLGLSMVYGFARQSGGDAAIESVTGAGTAIRLLLPRSEVTDMVIESTQDKEVKRDREESILVLEDDPDVRSFAVHALEGLGYRVLQATDAVAAMQVLEEEADKLDLLLSDVVLPGGVSGPELAAKAIDLYPKLKLVFMSGYADDLYTHDRIPGFDNLLLNKPFRLAELSKAIHDTLAE